VSKYRYLGNRFAAEGVFANLSNSLGQECVLAKSGRCNWWKGWCTRYRKISSR